MEQPELNWPGDPLRYSGKKLFIIDARNRVERRHLLDWLHGTWGEVTREDYVVLPLSDKEESLDLTRLANQLDAGGDDCLVIPVRVAWRISHFDKDRPLRLRDLLFGDPRMPGALRGRLILLRDRRRAQCLLGEPATIAALRARFAEAIGTSDTEPAAGFAAWVARQATLTLEVEERGVRGTRYKVPRFVANRSPPVHDFVVLWLNWRESRTARCANCWSKPANT